jgi:hypothetical protein
MPLAAPPIGGSSDAGEEGRRGRQAMIELDGGDLRREPPLLNIKQWTGQYRGRRSMGRTTLVARLIVWTGN